MSAVINKRDVALQAASPRTLSNDLSSFRTTGAPTNLPVIGSVTISASTVGTVDLTLTWTYTQGAKIAEEFIIYYAEGITNPTTSSPVLAKVDGAARSITIPGVPIEKSYKAGIVASRVSAAGVESTAIVNAWTRTGTAANITANLDGTAASVVVAAALNATANYFTTSASNPTGGANGDAHYNSSTNVMWFKISGTWTQGGTINADAITAGTLAAARIAASSITADKLNVSSLSAVSANLGTVTAGSITSSSSIDISGKGVFGGAYTNGGYTAAVHANMGAASQYGVVALAGTSGIAVVGVAGSGDTAAIQGTSGVSGVPGIQAVNTSGGTALQITGAMTITSSALVSNLRSATTLLADNSTKWGGFSIGSIGSGAATATFVGTNKPGANSSNTWWTVTDGSTTVMIPIWLT